MRMYSSQSTCVEVDWSGIKLKHMWIEVDTDPSKQGLIGLSRMCVCD